MEKRERGRKRTTTHHTSESYLKHHLKQSNILRNLVDPDAQVVDEAFIMANYSQLEPLTRRRMKELRLQGNATRLNYSSEYVDEEREIEAPLGFQPQTLRVTEGQTMQGILPLLAAHLRETERRRRTLSSKEAPVTYKSPANGSHRQQLYTIGEGCIDGHQGGTNPTINNVYPPNHAYHPNNVFG
ncbi:hypothetical protein Tco_0966822 [Tanacetum coccineum]